MSWRTQKGSHPIFTINGFYEYFVKSFIKFISLHPASSYKLSTYNEGKIANVICKKNKCLHP